MNKDTHSTHSISDEQFDQAVEALPKHMQSSRDLWRGIDQAIVMQQTQRDASKPRPTWVAIAAGVALIVSVLSAWQVNTHSVTPMNAQQVYALGETIRQQNQKFLVNYQQRQPVTELYRLQELAALDSAADEVRLALEREPNNAALLQLLQDIYQQQIDLTRQPTLARGLQPLESI